MNGLKFLTLLAFIIFGMVATIPVSSQPDDIIIVNGAETTRQEAVIYSQDLDDTTTGIGPRIVSQYANSLFISDLTTTPTDLQILIGQVPARVVFQYANANLFTNLVAVPFSLQTLINNVTDRVVFQFANTNLSKSLVYPANLVNDAASPQISDVIANMSGSSIAIITWTTDEFADSTVLYGTQPGVYSQTVSDPLYYKEHVVTLNSLTPGTTYYYKVRSTDRSGNTVTSGEYSFTAFIFTYLPVVVR